MEEKQNKKYKLILMCCEMSFILWHGKEIGIGLERQRAFNGMRIMEKRKQHQRK